MKKLIALQIVAVMIAASTALKAQDMPQEYLGLPGDNLNLYAVMQLFQDSKTLEEFEKNLNEQNSRINNLDLNGDNLVDYLMVIDNIDGDVHNIVLRDAVSPTESQDVAVFVVQRFPNGQVQVQLIGDEDLYGKNYIIEPIFDDEISGQTPNPGYTGNNTVVYGRNVTVVRTTPVIIASWPVIRFIYQPHYVVWRSRWNWGYYPTYWHPWTPYYWHYYYGYHDNWYNVYYGRYRRWNAPRYSHWNDYYYVGVRKYSPVVRVRIQSGNYRTTYSRPDMRKDGEDLYARSHPDQGRRAQPVSTTNSTARRSSNVSSTGNTQARQGTVSNSSTGRRTVTTTESRQSSGQRAVQNAGNTRRTTTAVTSRPAPVQKSGQNAVTTNRRSNTSVGGTSSNRSQTSKSVSTARSSGSTSSRQAASVSRSSNSSKSSTTKKEDKSKKTGGTTSSSTRRK